MPVLEPAQGRISGELCVPGDKSISHRAAILGSLAIGKTNIANYAPGADCNTTLNIMEHLGVSFARNGMNICISGVGMHGLTEPCDILDCGNSGTTMRLMSGVLAAQPFVSVLSGDASLRSRPMSRVIQPLRLMGATIFGRSDGKFAPIFIKGANLSALTYQSPVSSAQVKSAVLLAGLFSDGNTTVTEPVRSRDHTERMLSHFGITVDRTGFSVTIKGGKTFTGRDICIPGDISSAAFFVAAALIVPGSEIAIMDVGLNPSRIGFIEIAKAMGAKIDLINLRVCGGEPVGDIVVKHSDLRAIEIDGTMVPGAIDEIPLIAVIASQADGVTAITGAEELRVKESDRISAIADNLVRMGANIKQLPDGLLISGPATLKGANVKSLGDHRIAMSLAVASLIAESPVNLDDAWCIDISFPGFLDTLYSLKS